MYAFGGGEGGGGGLGDVLLHICRIEEEAFTSVAGLLITLRLWRLVRILSDESLHCPPNW